MNSNSNKKIVAFLAVMIVVAAIVGTIAVSNNKKDDRISDGSTVNTTEAQDQSATATDASVSYKDGSYTADGAYDTPGGEESITITVSIQNGVITDTTATSSPSDRDAQEYQDAFKSAYSGQVVGKKIDSVRLSRVAGSSLTSNGFNSAIDQIKNQAKV